MKKILNNDNLKELVSQESNSVDLLLTDIPYGLDNINALDLMQNNSNNTKGFMNKAWDTLPTIETLTEFNRVLKEGGWFITTFIPRQDLQTVLFYRLLQADFDISFSPIYHTFASGFPKGNNVSKKLDKRAGAEREVVGRNPNSRENCNKQNTIYESGTVGKTDYITTSTTPEAKYCDGLYGEFQPKPAVEIIVVAQKKYKAKSQIDHALNWYNERKELLEKGIKEEELSLYTKLASGGTWIDEGRIPVNMEDTNPATNYLYRYHNADKYKQVTDHGSKPGKNVKFSNSLNPPSEQGRYPANLLVSDNAIDVGRETESVASFNYEISVKKEWLFHNETKHKRVTPHQDKGDLSRFFSKDAWVKKHLPEFYKLSKKTLQLEEDAEKIYPFLNVSKASVEEKNVGLDEFESKIKNQLVGSIASNDPVSKRYQSIMQNTHVTAKNITLFAYLLKLFSKENDVVLDPYCGSGTTLIACELTNRNYIGIELEKEYYDIAVARVEYWRKEKEKWNNYEKSKLL